MCCVYIAVTMVRNALLTFIHMLYAAEEEKKTYRKYVRIADKKTDKTKRFGKNAKPKKGKHKNMLGGAEVGVRLLTSTDAWSR